MGILNLLQRRKKSNTNTPIKLYGPNGSIWMRDRWYTPHKLDNKGIVRFSDKHGQPLRNENGATYRMIKQGKDNWATPK
jgi:hypothetical protein